MKSWKVTIFLNGSSASIQTVVQARTYSEVKRMIEGQYGASLKTISSIVEVR